MFSDIPAYKNKQGMNMIDRLQPSKAHRWTKCAASPGFEAQHPEQVPTDEAREGTCAAWVADCVLRGDASAADDLVDRNHANGWLVTPDMAFYVQGYIDMIRARGGAVYSEQFVSLTSLIAGTLDSSTILATGTTLFVDDLKFGYQLHDVFGHLQLLIYCGALLRMMLAAGQGQQITHCQLGIYQPRAFHPDGIHRTWTITVAELWQWCEWIIARGDECVKPNPLATPGTHCADCRAATSCAALAATNYAGFSYIQHHQQRKMTSVEAAQEWRFLDELVKMATARKKALDAEIQERYNTEYFPGVEMMRAYGNRRFKFSAETVFAFTGYSPVDKTMVTPAELERRGANPEIMKDLTDTPFIGFKLKPIPFNHIAKNFSKG